MALEFFGRFFILCFVLVFVGCFEEKKDTQKPENTESQIIKSQNNQDSNQSKEDLESQDSPLDSPLQKELKKNLKRHLDSLSKDLQEKNLNHLQLEQNIGIQKHIEHFESLHGRKDIPKNNSKESLSQKIQKAYELQQERIEELRQKNDEISR